MMFVQKGIQSKEYNHLSPATKFAHAIGFASQKT